MLNDTEARQFLRTHRLPEEFLAYAAAWFDPLADSIAAERTRLQRPVVIGINGSQGSGKTTLADYLRVTLSLSHQLSVVALSLDDFYLTRSQREQLGHEIHPLLAVRGVPGTHDVGLAIATIESLLDTTEPGRVLIPRFDKARDERAEQTDWDRIDTPVDIVILEGWCVGLVPQTSGELESDVNMLERREDNDGVWRRYVNDCLAGEYQMLFRLIDRLVMLRAPGFDCVYRWRLEQEQKLAARTSESNRAGAQAELMNPEEIRRFIEHFQRLTEHALAVLPGTAHDLFTLNDERRIIRYQQPLG